MCLQNCDRRACLYVQLFYNEALGQALKTGTDPKNIVAVWIHAYELEDSHHCAVTLH